MKGYVKVCWPAAAVSNGFLRTQLEGVDVVLLVKPGLDVGDVLETVQDLIPHVTVDEDGILTKLEWSTQ